MPSLSITPPTKTSAPPPAHKSAGPPGNAAPPTHFAALLDQTSARTAPAEGPKNRPAQTEPRRRDAAEPKDDNNGAAAPDAQAAPVAEAAPAQSQPVAESTQGQTPSGEQPATPGAPTEDPAAAAAAAAAVAAVPTAAPATPAAPGTTPATAATAATAAAAVVAQAAVGATTAQPGSADGAASADASAASADGTPAGKLQIPAELLNTKADANGGQTKDLKNGDQPQRDLPPAPTLPPTADAAATPTTASAAAPSPPAEPGSTVALQAQPVATLPTAISVANGGVGGTVLTRGSVLQTAERVQELVRIATTRAGNARAILQLRPAELGQVDVHLRTTRNGLVATIAAHEQVGLDALQQAGNELRRTLEDKGVQLHSLDLQLGTGHNGFSNQGDAREASSGRRGAAATHGLGSDDTVAEDELTLTHAPSTPAGVLVDVQA
jgi:flagellar hook-length control protein FliK